MARFNPCQATQNLSTSITYATDQDLYTDWFWAPWCLFVEPIQLGRGLVAVTGETGTGKSLISSAFSLAAGARVRGADLVGSRGSTAAVQLQLELAEGHRASTAEVSSDWERRLRLVSWKLLARWA